MVNTSDFKKYYLKNKPVLCSKPPKKCEVLLASELAKILGARTEIQAPFKLGRIDILSKDYLIEAKYDGTTSEKQALGQLLLYAYGLRFKGQLGLALIGTKGRPIPGVHKFCRENKISIFYYNLNNLRWSLFYDPK